MEESCVLIWCHYWAFHIVQTSVTLIWLRWELGKRGRYCLRILSKVGEEDTFLWHEGAEERVISVGHEGVGDTVDHVSH